MKPLDDMTEPELKAMVADLAETVKAKLPPNTGFIVLAAPMGPGGIAQYVSNVRPFDAGKWMLEVIERWCKRDYVPRD